MTKRVCPKCGVGDVWTAGGMKRYICKTCGHYFDNKEWQDADDKDEPMSDTNADSLADWSADRADVGSIR